MSLVDFTNPGSSKQREARAYTKEFRDQHARRFASTYEKINQRPVGEMQPEGFAPPWLPPQRFMKWEAEGSFRFDWDYLSMANELASETASKYEEYAVFAIENKMEVPEIGGPVAPLIRRICGKPPLSPAIPLACMEGDPWILGVPGAPVNRVLESILRQSYNASSTEALRVIRESIAKFITSDTDSLVPTVPAAPPAAVAPRSIHTDEAPPIEMSEITYSQFLRECKGRKMKMPEIVAAWNEHKAHLAEELATV